MAHDPVLMFVAPLRSALDGSALPLATADLSRYLAHDFPRVLRAAEERIADALPALTPADFYRLANGDSTLRAEVERFRAGRWPLVDVSELRASDGSDADTASDDPEAWTILRGSSRFEVREVPRFTVHPASHGASSLEVWDNEQDTVITTSEAETATREAAALTAESLNRSFGKDVVFYVVVDTEDGDKDARDTASSVLSECGHMDYDPTDEDEAREAAEQANVEDYRQSAAGWPFAHNYAAAIDERDADDFDAAGFVVARHEPSGQVYAGIDGGGYDFTEAHWSRVYLRVLLFGPYAPPCIYVPTRDGLRRVVRGDDKAGV